MVRTVAVLLSVTITTIMNPDAEVVDVVQVATVDATVAEAEAPDEDADVDAAVAATARDSKSRPRSLRLQSSAALPCPKRL